MAILFMSKGPLQINMITPCLLIIVLHQTVASRITACEISLITTGGPGDSSAIVLPPRASGGQRMCELTVNSCTYCKLHITVESLKFTFCTISPPYVWNSCIAGCRDYISLYEPGYRGSTGHSFYNGSSNKPYTSLSKGVTFIFCISQAAEFTIKYSVQEKMDKYSGDDGDVGFLTSPAFPQGYASKEERYQYIIQHESSHFIRLWFTDWELHGSSRIKIYHNNTTNDMFSITRYGNGSRPFVMSQASRLVVVFDTGTNPNSFLGFRAEFNFTDKPTWDDMPYNYQCGAHYKLWGGDFYFNTHRCQSGMIVDCVWVVHRYDVIPSNEYIWLQVYDVVLENGDLLEIRSGNTSQGSVLKTQETIGPNDEFIEQDALYIHLRAVCHQNRRLKVVYTSYYNAQTPYADSPSYFCPQQQHFMCKNKRCIANYLKCDGINHCGDWSDENNCQDEKDTAPVCNTHYPCDDHNGWYCNSHQCDGKPDCSDGSDEWECQISSTTPDARNSHSSPDHYYWGTITPVVLICLILGIITCIVISYYVRRKRLLRERGRHLGRTRSRRALPTTGLDGLPPGVYGMAPPSYEEAMTASYFPGEGNVNVGYDGNPPLMFQAAPPPYTPKYDERLPIQYLTPGVLPQGGPQPGNSGDVSGQPVMSPTTGAPPPTTGEGDRTRVISDPRPPEAGGSRSSTSHGGPQRPVEPPRRRSSSGKPDMPGSRNSRAITDDSTGSGSNRGSNSGMNQPAADTGSNRGSNSGMNQPAANTGSNRGPNSGMNQPAADTGSNRGPNSGMNQPAADTGSNRGSNSGMNQLPANTGSNRGSNSGASQPPANIQAMLSGHGAMTGIRRSVAEPTTSSSRQVAPQGQPKRTGSSPNKPSNTPTLKSIASTHQQGGDPHAQNNPETEPEPGKNRSSLYGAVNPAYEEDSSSASSPVHQEQRVGRPRSRSGSGESWPAALNPASSGPPLIMEQTGDVFV